MRGIVARRHVNHINRDIRKFGRECRGEIVASGFDENGVQGGEFLHHLVDGDQVDGGIFPDRGVEPPVSTPAMRSGTSAPLRVRNSASSRV